MGVFFVEGFVADARHPGRAVRVGKLLVDSGSECTWIPTPVLRQAGIRVSKKDEPFLMADGRTITRSIGYAIVRAGGFETVDEVVFAQPGDLTLLGARTLEGFRAVVDPRRKRLVASGAHPAARAGHGSQAAVPMMHLHGGGCSSDRAAGQLRVCFSRGSHPA